MTDFKLLQQALDALEFPHDSEWSNKAKAIEALQHALTQPEKKEQRMTDEQIADWSYKIQIACNKSTSDSDINIIKLIQHIENLYEQGRTDERELAKPEQTYDHESDAMSVLADVNADLIQDAKPEPVNRSWLSKGNPANAPVRNSGAPPKPEQEPVRWFQQFGDAPPRKPWVGLTREEIVEAYCSIHVKEWAIGGMDDVLPFTRAIEAKLKEKNT